MAKIKLKSVDWIVEVGQSYDEVIKILNDAELNGQKSITLDELIMVGVDLKRISIVIDEIIFIRE